MVATVGKRAMVIGGWASPVSRLRPNVTVWRLVSGAGNAPVSIPKGLVHQSLRPFWRLINARCTRGMDLRLADAAPRLGGGTSP